MPEQSLLRLIKRWRRHEEREDWSGIPKGTRGLYVLYQQHGRHFDVVYIGVSGLGNRGRLINRLKRHHKRIRRWSHYSFFEIHDNVTGDELREIETILRTIFRHDSKVRLENVQLGSRAMSKLRGRKHWPKAGADAPSLHRRRQRQIAA